MAKRKKDYFDANRLMLPGLFDNRPQPEPAVKPVKKNDINNSGKISQNQTILAQPLVQNPLIADSVSTPNVEETAAENSIFRAVKSFDLEGGEKALFRRNMETLRVLRELRERKAAEATLEEKQILARYMGWGGAPHAFVNNQQWASEYQELRNFLTPTEYSQAKSTTRNAFYTSDVVISGIWDGLKRMGVSNQWFNVLEPAAGIGNFASYRPKGINPEFHFVEQDGVSSSILAWIYPECKRFDSGFQYYWQTNPVYDLAIGNPPFGQESVYDANFKHLSNFSIHNYFIAKSMNLVREGGIGAFVVSRYFMDASLSVARSHINQHSKFLGAIRLPNMAFDRSARINLVTDIVFFQKDAAQTMEHGEEWLNSNGLLCDYFKNHPEMIVGQVEQFFSERHNKEDIRVNFEGDLAKSISEKLKYLPANIFQHREKPEDHDFNIDTEFLYSSYFQSLQHNSFAISPSADIVIKDYANYSNYEVKNEKTRARIIGMIKIRDVMRELINAETTNAKENDLSLLRKSLNDEYDNFVNKHGYINYVQNMRAMSDDPSWALLSALELNYNPGISPKDAKEAGVEPVAPKADKADIFTKRILKPDFSEIKILDVKDGLLASLQIYGGINISYIASQLDMDMNDVRKQLVDSGDAFINPVSGEYEIRDKYLAGNVRRKLKQAIQAAENNPDFEINVEALKSVLPADIKAVDIGIQFGASWIPAHIFKEFLNEITDDRCTCSIKYVPVLGKWDVKLHIYNYVFDTHTHGIDEFPASKIIHHLFSNTPIIVYDEIYQNGETIKVVNQELTLVAKQKAEKIKNEFNEWVWQSDERRHELEEIYNDKFNTHVPPTYDGSHLQPVNMSSSINLRPHQKNAVWRALQEGSVLFDHVVGSGKTMIAIATIMEGKRMRMMNKPMIVVPNYLLSQWAQEFYKLYPTANVLCATNKDFEAKNRDALFAKIAVNNWDAIIVGHSSFSFIPVPREFQERFIEQQEQMYIDAKTALEAEGGDTVSLIKKIERARAEFRKKMDKLLSVNEKTKVIDFGDLGVDALFVDESQNFKNLFIASSMRVSGLGNTTGSGKALDLFMKCRYLQSKYSGRGVYFMTGTPISNTIAELYTIQRYLRYDQLHEKQISFFDEWASVFGQVVDNWELDGTGVRYKIASRFAKFQNVPELTAIYRSFADVVTNNDLEKAGMALPVPKIMNDAPVNHVVERSEDQAKYMEKIIDRMNNLPPDASIDNPLKITNDARKAGLDFRMINDRAEDVENSKVNFVVDNIYNIWSETTEKKGTQLVFCDLSVPKKYKNSGNKIVEQNNQSENDTDEKQPASMDDLVAYCSNFSVYDDIKEKLIAKGVPAGEIAFIHDANTELRKIALYRNMNDGNVRILLGSTSKMGAGMNVQQRLVALHNLDAPWRPSDIEQRNGRIIRQGNMFYEQDPENFEIQIFNYATKQTYDSRMWQVIEYKWKAIDQFRQGNILQRVIDDVSMGAASAAEMKAAASGNPLILEEVQLASELRSLEASYADFQRNQHEMRDKIPYLKKAEERLKEAETRYENDRKTLLDCTNYIEVMDKTTKQMVKKLDWRIFYNDNTIIDDKNIKEHFDKIFNQCVKNQSKSFFFGSYRGFKINIKKVHTFKKREEQNSLMESFAFTIHGYDNKAYNSNNLLYLDVPDFNPKGFFQRLDHFFAGNFQEEYKIAVNKAESDKKDLEQINIALQTPFKDKERLDYVRERHSYVITELKKQMAENNQQTQKTEEENM